MLWLVYFLIGLVLAIPYNLLAGGDMDNYIIMVPWIPALLMFYMVFAGVKGAIYVDYRHRWHVDPRYLSNPLFLAVTLWLVSPILLNWMSFAVGLAGYKQLASALFDWRFVPIFGVPVIVIVALFLAGMAYDMLAWIKKSI